MARRRNPRTGRKTVYLGHRVRDTGKAGLDNIGEVRGIARAILRDYRAGRISRAKAMRRLNLLELVVSRDRDFRGAKERKARNLIDRIRKRL